MIRCNKCGRTFQHSGRLKTLWKKPGDIVGRTRKTDDSDDWYADSQVCPICLTNEFLEFTPNGKKVRFKYRQGDRITSLDDMMKQELVYFHGKIYHKGWFQNWSLRMAANLVGANGMIFYAVKEEQDGKE